MTKKVRNCFASEDPLISCSGGIFRRYKLHSLFFSESSSSMEKYQKHQIKRVHLTLKTHLIRRSSNNFTKSGHIFEMIAFNSKTRNGLYGD